MRARALVIAVVVVAVVAAVAACPPSGGPRPFAPSPPAAGWEHESIKLLDGARCAEARDCASGLCDGEGCGNDGGICVSPQRACTRDLRDYCGCGGETFQASGSCANQRYAHVGACKQRNGDACVAAADCASGVCEGQGCGDGAPGVCVAADRACAQMMTEFCGCDGRTISSTTSCAGQRYAAVGACAPAAPRPDGATCLAATECASGVCEGQGCGADVPGVCVAKRRGCTKDRRPYCGCDGATFFSSGSCPGRRYAARGSCVAP